MRSISDPDLLDVWERTLDQKSAQIGLSLLSVTTPDISYEELSNLRIGERDRLLLQLREEIFGSYITGLIRCPECGELLEIALDAMDIRIISRIETPETEGCLHLLSESYEISFRMPDCSDLEAVSICKDVSEARYLILRRCIQGVLYQGKDASIEDLPAKLLDSIEEIMANADPQADVLLRAACASCRHEWDAIFDISSFLWGEIDSWARRTLQDVHALASAYSWSEKNILGMSSWRRKCYLDMVNR
jgi:hypothetical protein